MKVHLVLEGFRPGRVVRIRPLSWPDDAVPREEYTGGNREERFPSPDIFPKYYLTPRKPVWGRIPTLGRTDTIKHYEITI